MPMSVITSRPDETMALGRKLAPLLTAGDVVVLSGRLGCGKTLFVAGIAEGLGITKPVTSPTFLIARTYDEGFLPMIHVDVYRLGSISEFEDLALVDRGYRGVIVIEWGEAVAEVLPSSRLTVAFEMEGDQRTISFVPAGTWCDRDLGVLA